MKKNLIISCIAIIMLAFSACKPDKLGPIVNDGVGPGPVTNVKVENLNGAAKISYTVPSDPDILYVRAIYTSKQGQVRETKVSRSNNSLTVVGFGDTDAYKVTLYAVDQAENSSAPVEVTVNPLKPAVKIVKDSIVISADFGGINVKYVNPSAENLAIVVLANDKLGQFVPANTNYTNLKVGDFSTRGYAASPTKFGVFVRDRWGNLSDTIIVTLTPLFEQLLDRTKMKGLVLPTDAPLGYSGTIAGLFDGDTQNGFYHTGDLAVMPQWFTFDMGVTAKLSRLAWWMRGGSFLYSLHNPRVIEIWGSNNPNTNGSYDSSWILLKQYTQLKPSGLPNGQLSQADIDAAAAGETVTFPLNTPKVRYIRFKTLQNWSNGTYVNFYELSMWGDTK